MTTPVLSEVSVIASAVKEIFEKMPSYQQKVMRDFVKFLGEYEIEKRKENVNHDKLVLMKQKRDTLLQYLYNGLLNATDTN